MKYFLVATVIFAISCGQKQSSAPRQFVVTAKTRCANKAFEPFSWCNDMNGVDWKYDAGNLKLTVDHIERNLDATLEGVGGVNSYPTCSARWVIRADGVLISMAQQPKNGICETVFIRGSVR